MCIAAVALLVYFQVGGPTPQVPQIQQTATQLPPTNPVMNDFNDLLSKISNSKVN
jgi:hypothetical protein